MASAFASEAERVESVVHGMSEEVQVKAVGTEPQERRTLELPMNKD